MSYTTSGIHWRGYTIPKDQICPTQPVEYIDVGIPYQRIKNVLFHTADFPRSAEKCMIFVLIVHRTEKLLAWLTTIYIYFIFIFFLSFFFYYNTISPHGYLPSKSVLWHWHHLWDIFNVLFLNNVIIIKDMVLHRQT